MPTTRRYMDPNTRDYVVASGEYQQDDTPASKVTARLRTKRGSIKVLPNFGSLLHTIAGSFAGYDLLAKRYATECLDDLVKSGEIRELVVDVDKTVRSALVIIVSYRNRRGRKQTVRHTHRLTGA